MLIAALCVVLPITLLGGVRALGWTTTAFGVLGLIHAVVIIAFDVKGAPLDYGLAHSRLVLATAPVSFALLATGAITIGLRYCWNRRRTTARR